MAARARRFINDVALVYDGDECLIWPGRKKTGSGYGTVRKLGGSRNQWEYVHRIICEAVNGPPPTPKHQAAHSCGRGHEGCVTPRHLSWKTNAENAEDRIIHGTTNRGERNGSAILTEAKVREIRALAGKMSQDKIAARIGISQSQVSRILLGQTWKHFLMAGGGSDDAG